MGLSLTWESCCLAHGTQRHGRRKSGRDLHIIALEAIVVRGSASGHSAGSRSFCAWAQCAEPPPETGGNCSAREPATDPQGPSSCVSITHEIPARKGCSRALRPAVLVRGSQHITTSLHHCPSNGGPQNVCPLSRSHQGTFLFKASTLSEPNSPRLEAVHCSQWNLVLSNPGWLRTIQEPWPSKDNIGSVPEIPDRNCCVCNCNCPPASESHSKFWPQTSRKGRKGLGGR